MIAWQLIDSGVIAGTADEPRLVGSKCERCGTVSFTRQASCPKCTSQDVHPHELATRGTLWTWTIQCFPPKSPPYPQAGVSEFEPYGVGYVELPGEVRVEARLTESDPDALAIGMPTELTLVPVPGSSDTLTFAFRPASEEPHE